jgi:hypothetical protein
MSNAKFSTPMARYTGFAEVKVTFFEGSRRRTETGVIPVSIDIPESETTAATVAGDHTLLFRHDAPQGLAVGPPTAPVPVPVPEKDLPPPGSPTDGA